MSKTNGTRMPSVWGLAVLLLLSSGSAAARASQLDRLPGRWIDERGASFDLHALRGHEIVLTMAYASCHRVCPQTMLRMQALQRKLDETGSQAEFLIVGYDPERDDPATWRRYRDSHHLKRSNWHFLVGTRAAVEQTARELGFDFWQDEEHIMHDSRIVFLDAAGTLVRADADASFPSPAR